MFLFIYYIYFLVVDQLVGSIAWSNDLLTWSILIGQSLPFMEGVGVVLLRGEDDVSNKSIDNHIFASNLYNTKTSLSMDSILTMVTFVICIVDMLDSFVKAMVEACLYKLERLITLNKQGPNIQI